MTLEEADLTHSAFIPELLPSASCWLTPTGSLRVGEFLNMVHGGHLPGVKVGTEKRKKVGLE
jgi:hypothetical protein